MTKIAVAITAETQEKALEDIEKARELADIIELRIDYIKKFTIYDLSNLLISTRKPTIVTNRHKSEAGPDPRAGFDGPEDKRLDPEDKRLDFLLKAMYMGAPYIDIEYNYLPKFVKIPDAKLIVSYHNFTETPPNLKDIYNNISKTDADIIKIVTKPNIKDDVKRMTKLIESVDKDFIGICMGELGSETRLHPKNYLTFACLPGKASAPGQFKAEEIRKYLK